MVENTKLSRGPIDVFYDGDCPVCKLEVDLYLKFSDGKSIDWIDITSLKNDELPKGKDRASLLSKFHVRDLDSNWYVGVDAFARIWKQLPGFKHFAFLFTVPGLRQIAELGYRCFLKWQRWHRDNKRTKH